MIKIVFGLNRQDGMSHREFGEYWYYEHADLAKQLPGLRRYDLGFPEDPELAAYDGVAELYFEDEQSLEAAMDSEEGAEAASDLENFADTDDILQLVVQPRTLFDDQ